MVIIISSVCTIVFKKTSKADDSWKVVRGDRAAVQEFIAEHAVVSNMAAAVPALPVQPYSLLKVNAHPWAHVS